MPYLFVETGESGIAKTPVPEAGHLTIGRSSQCELRLDDRGASAKHCYVEMVAGKYWIVDLDSTNGTLVNGRRVGRRALVDGDVIRMGRTRIVFGEEDVGQKMRSDPEHLVGQQIGNYEIVQYLCRTTLGTNLLAVQELMGRKVVFKVLPPLLAMHGQIVERFHRQAKVGGLLNHPNIAATYDAGDYQSFHYLVSEYVEGESLKSMLAREGKLAPATAVSYGTQIARALAYLAEQKVIHRNLKPGNIFIHPDGTAKLADMWLAKNMDPETSINLTLKGQMFGTLEYMAPEQVEDPSTVDPRADTYALAAILFRMLCGRAVFQAKGRDALAQAVLDSPVPDPKAIVPTLPRSLARTVTKGLSKRPEDRHADAQELLDALEMVGVSLAVME